jgi:hypothetical protein
MSSLPFTLRPSPNAFGFRPFPHGSSNGRVLAIDSIKNSQGNIFNRYVPGAGVGATSVSVRRAKMYHAALRR